MAGFMVLNPLPVGERTVPENGFRWDFDTRDVITKLSIPNKPEDLNPAKLAAIAIEKEHVELKKEGKLHFLFDKRAYEARRERIMYNLPAKVYMTRLADYDDKPYGEWIYIRDDFKKIVVNVYNGAGKFLGTGYNPKQVYDFFYSAFTEEHQATLKETHKKGHEDERLNRLWVHGTVVMCGHHMKWADVVPGWHREAHSLNKIPQFYGDQLNLLMSMSEENNGAALTPYKSNQKYPRERPSYLGIQKTPKMITQHAYIKKPNIENPISRMFNAFLQAKKEKKLTEEEAVRQQRDKLVSLIFKGDYTSGELNDIRKFMEELQLSKKNNNPYCALGNSSVPIREQTFSKLDVTAKLYEIARESRRDTDDSDSETMSE
jgi:hypothetical protein